MIEITFFQFASSGQQAVGGSQSVQSGQDNEDDEDDLSDTKDAVYSARSRDEARVSGTQSGRTVSQHRGGKLPVFVAHCRRDTTLSPRCSGELKK